MNDELDSIIEKAIQATYSFSEVSLKKHICDKKAVFACSEISMLAHKQGIKGYDTMQVTIEKIVREL